LRTSFLFELPVRKKRREKRSCRAIGVNSTRSTEWKRPAIRKRGKGVTTIPMLVQTKPPYLKLAASWLVRGREKRPILVVFFETWGMEAKGKTTFRLIKSNGRNRNAEEPDAGYPELPETGGKSKKRKISKYFWIWVEEGPIRPGPHPEK